MPLTDAVIRATKPRERTFRVYDTGGLYLEITPAGSRLWRLKYRFAGKEKRLALGRYPEVGLADARVLRDEARRVLAQGEDPAERRREEKLRRQELARHTFEAVAEEWFARCSPGWAPSYARGVIQRLRAYAFPYLGRRPVAEIEPPEVLAVVRRAERECSPYTARKVLLHIGQVMRYAVSTGRAERDPTPDLKGALAPVEQRHMPAPEDPREVGALLRVIDGYQGTPVVRAALRLLPLLFVRPGELRHMRWEQVDLEAAEWRFTASKTGHAHLVPLARQAVAILEELRPHTAHLPGGWVFPGARSALRPLSAEAINAAYRRMGIDTRNEITAHGWRAVARTLLAERLGYEPDVVEHQLGHEVPDRLGRAYNRTRFLEQRREMMQRWADYLDMLREGDKVVVLPVTGRNR